MNDIQPVSIIEQRISSAATPEESQQNELYTTLALQYAQETHNYTMMVQFTKLYFDARRKTTELIMPFISHGGSPMSHTATLGDFSITRQEWNRRQKEYNIPIEKAHEYFDDCIAHGWNPSIAGMLKVSGNGSGGGDEHKSRLATLRRICDELLRDKETPRKLREWILAMPEEVGK